MTDKEPAASATPLTDRMRELSTELNPLAMNTLLEIVQNEMMRDTPELYDPNGEPVRRRGITIATSLHTYEEGDSAQSSNPM